MIRRACTYAQSRQSRRCYQTKSMKLWIYASSLAPRTIFHIYICNLTNSEDPEEMSHDASFREGPHCLLLLSSTKTVF